MPFSGPSGVKVAGRVDSILAPSPRSRPINVSVNGRPFCNAARLQVGDQGLSGAAGRGQDRGCDNFEKQSSSRASIRDRLSRHRHRHHRFLQCAIRGVVEADLPVESARREAPAIRRERDGVDAGRVPAAGR